MEYDCLTVVCPSPPSLRCANTVFSALEGCETRSFSSFSETPPAGKRILFVLSLDDSGTTSEQLALLRTLRNTPHFLDGCIAGLVVDGSTDLYTKSAARDLVFAANQAGCAFPGRPLVEAAGNLHNFAVQAKNAVCTLEEAYRLAVRSLAERILTFDPPRHQHPKLLALHASSRRTSNTMALWDRVRADLPECFDIKEVGLRNGTLEDCAGCPYTTCLHFGEKGGCFYGGVIVEDVYPAVREADAMLLICPNYNDALAANLTACINRLTALYRTTPFTDKALLGIVVSGYSGSDIVASQLISALCMNKGFWLPPRFCMLETANDAGTAVKLPGIDRRLAEFSAAIARTLCK